ncbi:MAG: glycoside hydrolase family 2 TIM barrel-domain containing protein [Planctomycetota bacterium]
MNIAPIGCTAALLALSGCASGNARDWGHVGAPSVVEVQAVGDGYQLIRNGSPFFVRGVGGTSRLDMLADFGGNAIRTWDAEDIDELMNEAHRLGIAVQAGIWLEHERHGYDYNDPAIKKTQLDKVRRLVLRYRDHPALLSWGVGNEVELGGSLDTALVAIEDAARLIKQLDPNHPTVAVVAEIGDDKARRIAAECPSIDIIGVNAYGGLATVPDRLREQDYEGPYMITEFGPLGHWEGAHTGWGAPIEMTGAEKADFIASNYASAIHAQHPGGCLGSFAFLWGTKQETTETWFGLILPTGEPIETVDRLSAFWTGTLPEQRAPRVEALNLDLVDPGAVGPGSTIRARVTASDPNGDPLSVDWRIIGESTDRKSGGDAEAAPEDVSDPVIEASGMRATLRAPSDPGAYRVLVTVRDGNGRAGTANVPFLVTE